MSKMSTEEKVVLGAVGVGVLGVLGYVAYKAATPSTSSSSSNANNTYGLTSQQLATAQQIGLTPQQYAAGVAPYDYAQNQDSGNG